MIRPVEWSRDALDDLKEQVAYIHRRNPNAARRVADRIRDTAASLAQMTTGRPGRMGHIYEKLVTGLPYIISYSISRIEGHETVVILHVIHTSRNWPAGEWPA